MVVPLLHVLPQGALVAVRRAAPVLAHVRTGLFVHRLDVDFELPLVRKSLRIFKSFKYSFPLKEFFSGSENGRLICVSATTRNISLN